jgi:hypothetical protein
MSLGAGVLYPALLFAVAAVELAVATLVWVRRSNRPGAELFARMMLALGQWAFFYALELWPGTLAAKIVWAKLQYPAIVSAPVLWFLTTRAIARREMESASVWQYLVLAIIPVITILLAWTNEWHGLIWSATTLEPFGTMQILRIEHGLWFWVHVGYSYVMLAAGSLLLARHFMRSWSLYRWQALTLLGGALIPWAGNVY